MFFCDPRVLKESKKKISFRCRFIFVMESWSFLNPIPINILVMHSERDFQCLSPRKLHPVLRIEHAKKDWFTTVQQNYFFLDI